MALAGPRRRGGIANRARYGGRKRTSERLRQTQGTPDDGYGSNWRETTRIIKVRDNYTCQSCGVQCLPGEEAYSDVVLTVDHKIPRAQGGTNAHSNLWTLCDICHARKPGRANRKGAALLKASADNVRKRRHEKRTKK
jgi:5-methylcytosine-specific restriction protein A